MLSASRRSRIRAPIYSSTELAPLEEVDLGLAFFTVLLAFDDLEKAKTANANVSTGIGMKWRLSLRHENPIFTLYVGRQPRAGQCREAQRAVGRCAINVVRDLAAHRMTIAMQPIPAIASAV